MAVTAQKKQKKGTEPQLFKDKFDTLSYILGADIGKNMPKGFFTLKPEAMLKGIQDANNKVDTLFSAEIIQKYIMELQNEARAYYMNEQKKEMEKNLVEAEAFLEKNKQDSSIQVTSSGLQYKIIQKGQGASPKATDKVKVHYEGRLVDGTIFDSSLDRGEPVEFPLNAVISGWTEGLQLMSTGGVYEFYVHPKLGYGEQANNKIPGNSLLIFKVELLDFKSE